MKESSEKNRLQKNYVSSYSCPAAAKSAAGIGVPLVNRAHNRASGFFMREALPHLFVVSMVGRVGEPQGSPGSLLTGYANPARLTTLEIGVSGGELSKLNREAATMATTPTRAMPESLSVDCYRKLHRAQISAHSAFLKLHSMSLSGNMDPLFVCLYSYLADDLSDINAELTARGLFNTYTSAQCGGENE